MPRRLPPLSSLRVFESAGRLCSFKLAAAELNVTPSAVSHGIVGLEQALGVDLFVRGPRGLSLTPEGADYLLYVSEALTLIATATQRLPAAQGGRGIAISCAPTLASRWLLPRLHGFRAQWPDVRIIIDTSQRHVGFPVDGFDFAIRMGRSHVAVASWRRLFGEQLVPVCAPAYRDTLLDAQGRVDWARAALIHVTLASEDWQAWREQVGDAMPDDIDLAAGLRLDTIQLAFEAAAAGLGVVLGRRPLVDRDLADGVLVALNLPVLQAETAYWLVSAEGVERRSELLAFRDWLVAQAHDFAA
ncbi:LysR substrate-binding domain-containing protein [Bordetella sp. BOR01]|uniref:LysR substrate-binding domain-containing protein n=1 Tax=Bordetella sp. BOR01 TaxID=2854779 RepID=UPI001C45A597|nr:LysR substrate-binding domain-containing protein [Bordetella sp. BOR01]MBV7486817.1 LysR family transcriptional regulator [Bordetella sp. BOR01]